METYTAEKHTAVGCRNCVLSCAVGIYALCSVPILTHSIFLHIFCISSAQKKLGRECRKEHHLWGLLVLLKFRTVRITRTYTGSFSKVNNFGIFFWTYTHLRCAKKNEAQPLQYLGVPPLSVPNPWRDRSVLPPWIVGVVFELRWAPQLAQSLGRKQ